RQVVFDAVAEVLAAGTGQLVIETSNLFIADDAGARALIELERMVRDASAALIWQGGGSAAPALSPRPTVGSATHQHGSGLVEGTNVRRLGPDPAGTAGADVGRRARSGNQVAGAEFERLRAS